MNLYLVDGRYYQKQADCPTRKFETVEFPFAATPKAEFVAWMNSLDRAWVIGEPSSSVEAAAKFIGDAVQEELLVDQRVQEQAERPKPEPHQPRAPRTADSVEQWLMDEATPAEIESVFTAIGVRFHEMRSAS